MSCQVVIFGAGIAGLTAAHELVHSGYGVSVYEATDQPGGFFRSSRLSQDNMPSEYSWHGMGPWYHNAFDLMRHIPFNEKGSIYDSALSRPVDFGIFPDADKAEFYNEGLKGIPKMFRMNTWEFMKWSYLMLKTWTSNNRSKIEYDKLNAAEAWEPLLKDKAYKAWRSCFGPWIGSDWSKVSLQTAGEFFRKQLITKPAHRHKADQDGPAWKQGAGDGWLLLKGPSSEYWFDPWVKYLKEKGVKFFWRKALTKLEFDGTAIVSAFCGEEKIQADRYILALNPFMTADILSETPALERLEELKLFKPLIRGGPHTQVSFRVAFSEEIKFPRERTAVVVSDSEFNLTLFAEEQVWDKEVDLGKNIKSLWTGTSCIGSVPGKIYHKPVSRCTKEEFIEEVKAQIFSCGALDELVKEANNGKGLREFSIIKIEVWHEWKFSSEGIRPLQPKWVNSTDTQAYLPAQKTPVSNLFLAGAHTRTQAQVWSIEGAVESGRRAAKAIDDRVEVIDQYQPLWIKGLSKIDDILYSMKAPQVIDSIALSLILSLILSSLRHFRSKD
ncbi:MAG: FAD-dependent oxidoreductase [Candidatus Eremiobacteraeota bacterium]|nr:FAD-dependent oxidoreductase [Candidatus Eremiobacteraeota bacterium]